MSGKKLHYLCPCVLLRISSHNICQSHQQPNGFTDKEMTCLALGLASNDTLKKLNIRCCLQHNGRQGWEALASILRNPRSVMTSLDMAHSSALNNSALALLADALKQNNKMEEMPLEWLYDEPARITDWKPLSDVLCNGNSIETTFNSNHTLGRLSTDDDILAASNEMVLSLPYDVRSLLVLNRDLGPVESARRKIINRHFSGTFCMEPFLDMDAKVLPRVIAWMAKDDHGKSLLYQFIKNSALFEI